MSAQKANIEANTVSIHAPREGCDVRWHVAPVYVSCFNSRTPGGVRLICISHTPETLLVSIHAPREGCDIMVVSHMP